MGVGPVNTLIVVDTDILIDAARRVEEAIQCLRDIERESIPAVSIITQMELLVGCRNKTEQKVVEHFLERFQVIRLTEPMSDIAVGLLQQHRLRHGLSIPDALIAATAMALNQPFISKNQRHFRFIKKLQLQPYPRPRP